MTNNKKNNETNKNHLHQPLIHTHTPTPTHILSLHSKDTHTHTLARREILEGYALSCITNGAISCFLFLLFPSALFLLHSKSVKWKCKARATAPRSFAGGEGRAAGQLLPRPPAAGSAGARQRQQRQWQRRPAAAAADRPDRGAHYGAAGQHQKVPGECRKSTNFLPSQKYAMKNV